MNITEPMFLALTALVDEPRHGYGLVQEVDRLSGGRVQLKIGTLYGVLDRLAADGLVELDREEVEKGRLRRYYRLTDDGAGALAAEADRLAANARVATARLRARRPGVALTALTALTALGALAARSPLTALTALGALAARSPLTALAARAASDGGVA
ncbi:PadR family transcriptional regulator [Nonomuraea sp. NPDC047897]|uniref:PadR family transcriptional regulator n=1 Tax=Nonomuraea sp. NPDC047897 TaxID=3364346 RepID=UPI003717A7D7